MAFQAPPILSLSSASFGGTKSHSIGTPNICLFRNGSALSRRPMETPRRRNDSQFRHKRRVLDIDIRADASFPRSLLLQTEQPGCRLPDQRDLAAYLTRQSVCSTDRGGTAT